MCINFINARTTEVVRFFDGRALTGLIGFRAITRAKRLGEKDTRENDISFFEEMSSVWKLVHENRARG